jgi:hypothetical protein
MSSSHSLLSSRERSLPFSDPACWLAALCAVSAGWLVASGKVRRARHPASTRLVGAALMLGGAAAALRDSAAGSPLLTNCLVVHGDLVCRASLFSMGALLQMTMMVTCAACSFDSVLTRLSASGVSLAERAADAAVLLSNVLIVPHAAAWLLLSGFVAPTEPVARLLSLYWVWCIAPSVAWQWRMRRSPSAWLATAAMLLCMVVHWFAPIALDSGWSPERVRNSPLFSWQYAWYLGAAPAAAVSLLLRRGGDGDGRSSIGAYARGYAKALGALAGAPFAVAALAARCARRAALASVWLYGACVGTWWYLCARGGRVARRPASSSSARYEPVEEPAAPPAEEETSNFAGGAAEAAAAAPAGRLSVHPGDEGLAPLQDNPARRLLELRSSTLAGAVGRPRQSAMRASWAWVTSLFSVPAVSSRERTDTDARAPRVSDSRELTENFEANPAAGAAAFAKGSVIQRMRAAVAPKHSSFHTSIFHKFANILSPATSPQGSFALAPDSVASA